MKKIPLNQLTDDQRKKLIKGMKKTKRGRQMARSYEALEAQYPGLFEIAGPVQFETDFKKFMEDAE